MAATSILKMPNTILLPNSSNVSLFFGTSIVRLQSHQNSIQTLSRRLLLASVSGLWDAVTGGNSAREAVIAIRRGMSLFRRILENRKDEIFGSSLCSTGQNSTYVIWAGGCNDSDTVQHFRNGFVGRQGKERNVMVSSLSILNAIVLMVKGDVLGSLLEFDKAIELDPRQKAYLWQRGLSLYYLNRYEEGAEQFRIDVAQNPNDTEESIWCFLCEAQLYGFDEARRRFLEVGIDSQSVMREAYGMFKDGGDPEKLVAAFSNARESEYFYASLYAGLYYESQNEADAAKLQLVAACRSHYGSRSDDYMASLAKVHCDSRNWRFD